MDLNDYKGIVKATELVALDNGGINRDRPSEQRLSDLSVWLDKVKDSYDLMAIDLWFRILNEEELSAVSCGGEEEMYSVLLTAPPGTDDFLHDYLGEVC